MLCRAVTMILAIHCTSLQPWTSGVLEEPHTSWGDLVLYVHLVFQGDKALQVCLFSFFSNLGQQHIHALKSFYSLSNRYRVSLKSVGCRIHPYPQCQFQLQQRYFIEIFILDLLYHAVVPSCSLETRFLKLVKIEPLMMSMQTSCQLIKSRARMCLIQSSSDTVQRIPSKPFSHPLKRTKS